MQQTQHEQQMMQQGKKAKRQNKEQQHEDPPPLQTSALAQLLGKGPQIEPGVHECLNMAADVWKALLELQEGKSALLQAGTDVHWSVLPPNELSNRKDKLEELLQNQAQVLHSYATKISQRRDAVQRNRRADQELEKNLLLELSALPASGALASPPHKLPIAELEAKLARTEWEEILANRTVGQASGGRSSSSRAPKRAAHGGSSRSVPSSARPWAEVATDLSGLASRLAALDDDAAAAPKPEVVAELWSTAKRLLDGFPDSELLASFARLQGEMAAAPALETASPAADATPSSPASTGTAELSRREARPISKRKREEPPSAKLGHGISSVFWGFSAKLPDGAEPLEPGLVGSLVLLRADDVAKLFWVDSLETVSPAHLVLSPHRVHGVDFPFPWDNVARVALRTDGRVLVPEPLRDLNSLEELLLESEATSWEQVQSSRASSPQDDDDKDEGVPAWARVPDSEKRQPEALTNWAENRLRYLLDQREHRSPAIQSAVREKRVARSEALAQLEDALQGSEFSRSHARDEAHLLAKQLEHCIFQVTGLALVPEDDVALELCKRSMRRYQRQLAKCTTAVKSGQPICIKCGSESETFRFASLTEAFGELAKFVPSPPTPQPA